MKSIQSFNFSFSSLVHLLLALVISKKPWGCRKPIKHVHTLVNISTVHINKGGCVIQIEQTKALCNSYQHILKIIVYRSQRSVSDIDEADLCLGLE